MSDIILEARAINKDFHDPVTVRVLTDISFQLKKENLYRRSANPAVVNQHSYISYLPWIPIMKAIY